VRREVSIIMPTSNEYAGVKAGNKLGGYTLALAPTPSQPTYFEQGVEYLEETGEAVADYGRDLAEGLGESLDATLDTASEVTGDIASGIGSIALAWGATGVSAALAVSIVAIVAGIFILDD
jgi:hypothetical protein